MKYAKAYASAAAVVISFIVGELWIELPPEITGCIAVLLVPLVVAYIPNKEALDGGQSTGATSHHHSSPTDRLSGP